MQVTFGGGNDEAHVQGFVDDTHQAETADEEQKGVKLASAYQLQRFVVAVGLQFAAAVATAAVVVAGIVSQLDVVDLDGLTFGAGVLCG